MVAITHVYQWSFQTQGEFFSSDFGFLTWCVCCASDNCTQLSYSPLTTHMPVTNSLQVGTGYRATAELDVSEPKVTQPKLTTYIKQFACQRTPHEFKGCIVATDHILMMFVICLNTDYGFEIPDLFVVGYALDYNEHFRDLNVSFFQKLVLKQFFFPRVS